MTNSEGDLFLLHQEILQNRQTGIVPPPVVTTSSGSTCLNGIFCSHIKFASGKA
jgi:hypothetical protein